MRAYSIVGMNHRGTEQFVDNLAAGTEVLLVREPANPYDPNAIMVWVGDRHVGYIPKSQNKILAQYIDQKGRMQSLPSEIATDSSPLPYRTLPAVFVRSPHSKYPMVEV